MSARGLLGVSLVALAACAPTDARFEGGPLGSEVVRCPALPATIELGQVPVGGVGSARLDGVGGDVTVEASAGFSVRRDGDALVIDVQPVTAGVLEGTLTASAPRCEPATSRLVAEGMARCLELAPSVTFPDAERSCGSVTTTLDVHNRCDVSVAMHGGGVTEPDDGADAWCPGGPPCQEFGLVGGESVLAPNAASTLTLRFSPANAGQRLGDLRLVAAERNGTAEYLVSVRGAGLPRATVTESFDAPEMPKGDLLVIVDTSPSMSARSEANVYNFRNYALYLQASQLDVQVTVASAERGLAGTTVGSANARDADFETKFAQLLGAVPPGTEDTSCMEQALALFEASPSFRRPGVPAAIVCVTDGPDRAEGPWQPLLGRFTARLGLPTAMIVGPFSEVPGCASTLDDGRLWLWSDASNGVHEEICTPDWAKALENLGRSAFGWYFLASPSQPVLRIVEVAIDGVPLPNHAWEWQPVMQSVFLGPLFAPEPGQVVSVTYEPRCP